MNFAAIYDRQIAYSHWRERGRCGSGCSRTYLCEVLHHLVSTPPISRSYSVVKVCNSRLLSDDAHRAH